MSSGKKDPGGRSGEMPSVRRRTQSPRFHRGDVDGFDLTALDMLPHSEGGKKESIATRLLLDIYK
jgi:hypothetical protein